MNKLRQSMTVELEGSTPSELHWVRLRFEKAMADLEKEILKYKGTGRIVAVIPGKVRELGVELLERRG